jgi:transcriptional regulator with XRE-family HTH domain
VENSQLAQRIRAFRKLKGLTQTELSQRMGMSIGILGAIERGNRRPDERILNKISEALGIELDEIMMTNNKGKEA